MRRILLGLFHVIGCKIIWAISNGELASQFTLTHLPNSSAATTASLWMLSLSGRDEQVFEGAGIRSGLKLTLYEFALQDGFAGDVDVGDLITDDGVDFTVKSIDVDQAAAVWKVNCTEKKARVLKAA